jgi:methyl-accepting chemotaxis protein
MIAAGAVDMKSLRWIGGLGIGVKLQAAFAAVSIMTVVAAAVAITSFSATEQGVQSMATREVPQMTDALRLSAISGDISAAAARLVSARTADEQTAMAARIRERYQAFTALLDHLRQGRGSADLAVVETAAQKLGVNLQALAQAIEERSRLRRALDGKLDVLNKVHAGITDRLGPIVDDSYFDVVTSAEEVGRTADKTVKSLIDGGLQTMQAMINVNAETNLITGLMTASALTSSPPILAILEDRFTSSAARLSKQLGKFPPGAKFDPLKQRVEALLRLADFACRGGDGGNTDMARLENVFRAQEGVSTVLIALVDDLNFDLVVQSEDAVKRSSKVVKDLVANQITGLRNALDVVAQTHLLASVLSEASVAKDAAILVPFQDRFRALSDSLLKSSKAIDDGQIRRAIDDLLALGRGEDSILAIRAAELAAEARADSTIEDNAKIQSDLDRAVSTLVREVEVGMQSGIAQLGRQIDQDRILLIAAAVLSLLVSGAIAMFYVQRNLVRRLFAICDAMRRLSSGDTGLEVAAVGDRDEIGEMARAVLVFRDAAVAKERLEAETAEQRRVSEDAQQRAVAEERKVLEEQRRSTVEQARVVRAIKVGLGKLAAGDLMFRITEAFPPAYEEIKNEFNFALDHLSETIKVLSESTRQVSNAAAEISTSTVDLSRRAEEQASTLERTSTSLDDISEVVKQNADDARQAGVAATGARDIADRNGQVVTSAVEAMGRIDDSSRKISDIIGVIDEIARQTNLLALNAAVEAARAGDAGRGFAVVASEVRSLAQRSSQAAADIKHLITQSATQVRDGVGLVNSAGTALADIVTAIKALAGTMSGIASASARQVGDLERINVALAKMDEVARENFTLAQANAATARSLDQQAKAMDERVGRFRFDTGASDTAPRARPARRASAA